MTKAFRGSAFRGAVSAPLCLAGMLAGHGQWDPGHFERFGGPGGGPRPPIAPFTMAPLPTRRVVVPMVFPVIGARSWRDGYNTNRDSHRHTGIDILAPKMRPVIAPFPGILGFKTQTFWIWGDNGFKCLGTHLNDDTPGNNDNRAHHDFMFAPNLRPGDRVTTGQLIGYVGDSGIASGPHLHFELFAVENGRNELVSPFPSLKAAGRIGVPRAVLVDPLEKRPPVGQARIDGCIRAWDPTRRVLTLLLVARQTAGGRAFAYTAPTWYRLTVPPAVLAAAGGSSALTTLPGDRVITFSVAEAPAPPPARKTSRTGGATTPRTESGTALRLILPALPEAELPESPQSKASVPIPAEFRHCNSRPASWRR